MADLTIRQQIKKAAEEAMPGCSVLFVKEDHEGIWFTVRSPSGTLLTTEVAHLLQADVQRMSEGDMRRHLLKICILK